MSWVIAFDRGLLEGYRRKEGGKGKLTLSYTVSWTPVRENITELPVGDKLLSQMFRQFIRRAQTGTNNQDM